jgi:hypothetical protein
MKMFLKGAAVGGIASALVVAATAALAGTGVGGIFNLGQTNTVNAKTSLKGSTAKKNLQITNTGSGSALGLKVGPGHPPMTVDSSVKVANLNADKLDGLSSKSLQRAYARTVVVSPKATAEASGNALKAAVASITTAAADKRYMVEVEPGIYDLGNSKLTMKSFVDIEGSGVGATTITRNGGADWFDGTVAGATNTELRLLTVENTGGGTQSVAIVAQDVNPFSVRWVEAKASGAPDNAAILVHGDGAHADLYGSTFTATGGDNAYAVYYSGGCSATMTLSDATASGATTNNWGVRQNRCNATPITNSRITSTGIGIEGDSSCGLFCIGAGPFVRIQNSVIHGATNSIHSACCMQTRVSSSMLSGGPLSSPFTTCIYVWDEDYAAASTTACP